MKHIILFLTMLLICALSVVGATVTTINSPANASYTTDNTVTVTYNVTGNASVYSCAIYQDGTGVSTNSGVANNTATTYTTAPLSDAQYYFNISCTNSVTDADGDAFTDTFVTVDTVAPTVSVQMNNANATNGQWVTSGAMDIGVICTDTNADKAILLTTMNASSNLTQTYGAYPTGSQSYTTATALNFTGYTSVTLLMPDNNTGAYYYAVRCNDSAGQSTTSSIYYVYVDSTAPSAFYILGANTTNNVAIPNGTYTTDYTPKIYWNVTTELNFSRYEIWMNSSFNTVNVTTKTTLSSATTTLNADTTYAGVRITAYDVAGNSVNATVSWDTIITDSTSRYLNSGWNIIMNTGNAMTLATFLTDTGATSVSWFNSTGYKNFTTHVSGGSGGTTSVPAGEAVFVYMASVGAMEDLVVNYTGVGQYFNLTNVTATSNWSIACDKNYSTDFTFSNFGDYYLDGNKSDILSLNVTYLDLYNNSASVGKKYLPYVNNWSTSKASTPIKFGDCMWLYMDTAVTTAGYHQINWYSIT
jgi:hypothetical protein